MTTEDIISNQIRKYSHCRKHSAVLKPWNDGLYIAIIGSAHYSSYLNFSTLEKTGILFEVTK